MEEVRRRSESLVALLRRFSRLWGFLVFLLVIVLIFRQVVLPFILASMVAYILAPVINRLEPKIGRGAAVALTYVAILGMLAVFVGVLLPALFKDLARLRDGAPELMSRLNDEWLPRASAWLEHNFGELLPRNPGSTATVDAAVSEANAKLFVRSEGDGQAVIDLSQLKLYVHEQPGGGWILEPHIAAKKSDLLHVDLRSLMSDKGGEWTLYFGEWLQSALTGIAAFLTRFVLTFMLAAFILIDLRRVNRFMRSLVPVDFRPAFDEIMRGVDDGMAGVIRGQALICVINGVLTYIGLLIIGVKYSLLLGILATVFSLVPIFGTIISSVPILTMALLSSDHGIAVGKSAAMLAWISGIHLVEANYLNPKIMGGTAHIHPVIVVFALLAGEHMYGLTGALLAVPVASMIQTVFMFARRNATAFAQGDFSSVAMRREDVMLSGSVDLGRSSGPTGEFHRDLNWSDDPKRPSDAKDPE